MWIFPLIPMMLKSGFVLCWHLNCSCICRQKIKNVSLIFQKAFHNVQDCLFLIVTKLIK